MDNPFGNTIPLFKPSVTHLEIDAVTEVLKSGWWGLGQKTEEFEKKFAEFVGVKYAVAVNNATVALDLTVKAMIGKTLDSEAYDDMQIEYQQSEIIVPALTFVSTGLAALYNNYKVVFADINEETLCINWKDVYSKVTPATKMIIPVHYAGRYAGGSKIGAPELLKDIEILQDAAHAVGNPLAGKTSSSVWSFHVVKNLATGDGGMITTNDEEVYKKLLPLRWVGIDKSTYQRLKSHKYNWDYNIETVGYKAHMNDITAALGLAQLYRITELNQARKILVRKYLNDLAGIEWLRLPMWDDNSSWHMFVVRLPAKHRNRFIDYLKENGISAGVHYKPLTHYKIFPQTTLPVTDRVWKTLVTLPLFPDLTISQHDYIVEAIKKFRI